MSGSGPVPGRGGKVDPSTEHSWIRPSTSKVIHNNLGQQKSSDKEVRSEVRGGVRGGVELGVRGGARGGVRGEGRGEGWS